MVDLAAFRRTVEELSGFVSAAGGQGEGTRWLRRVATRCEGLARLDDPDRIVPALTRLLRSQPRRMTKGEQFEGDAAAWDAWNAFKGDSRKSPVRRGALRDALRAPFDRWLAPRLVRLFPVVTALYERVKARHRSVDQLDLLLKLRDLLAGNKAVRADYQGLFDHVLVDEFQDTDPLQAEVLLYLCEAGAVADGPQDVALAPGRLTIVGDPKQSIYRFRRADVAMYAAKRQGKNCYVIT